MARTPRQKRNMIISGILQLLLEIHSRIFPNSQTIDGIDREKELEVVRGRKRSIQEVEEKNNKHFYVSNPQLRTRI